MTGNAFAAQDTTMSSTPNPSSSLGAFRELLEIRLQGEGRRARIIGLVFLLGVVGYIALGTLGSLEGRAGYLASIFPIAFGLGYLMAWGRFTLTKRSIELVDALLRS